MTPYHIAKTFIQIYRIPIINKKKWNIKSEKYVGGYRAFYHTGFDSLRNIKSYLRINEYAY